MKFPLSKLSIIGLLVALSVAVGYLLASLPNVELVTSTVFISGYLTGLGSGIFIGALSIGLYSMLNPYGIAPPPLFLAQILSYAIVGGAGGLMGRIMHQIQWKQTLFLGLCGLFFTVQYAVLTTIAYVITSGNREVLFWGSLLQGFGFYITHMITNTLFFLLLVPFVLNRLYRLGWVSQFRERLHD